MSHEVINRLLLACELFLVPLRAGDGFDDAEFERLCTALQTCVEVWKSADSIPKSLANVLVDLWPGIQSAAYPYDAQEAAKINKAADIVGDLTRQICSVG